MVKSPGEKDFNIGTRWTEVKDTCTASVLRLSKDLKEINPVSRRSLTSIVKKEVKKEIKQEEDHSVIPLMTLKQLPTVLGASMPVPASVENSQQIVVPFLPPSPSIDRAAAASMPLQLVQQPRKQITISKVLSRGVNSSGLVYVSFFLSFNYILTTTLLLTFIL